MCRKYRLRFVAVTPVSTGRLQTYDSPNYPRMTTFLNRALLFGCLVELFLYERTGTFPFCLRDMLTVKFTTYVLDEPF